MSRLDCHSSIGDIHYIPQHSRADHPARRRRQEQWKREELLANLAFMAFMLLSIATAMCLYLGGWI